MLNKDKLKQLLIQDGYEEANGLDRTVDNLMNLTGDAANKLAEWVNNGVQPYFEPIEGIDSSILRDQLQMKDAAIILSYGMLLLDPKGNSARLKSLLKGKFIYVH